jgi:arabinose-5-phosphate isomerase
MITNKEIIIEIGKKAINTEINGIGTILDYINDDFVKVIDIIMSNKGRVFLSAVGKPGYIARKAAATFTSTGTPSFFIHPDEASHGDLGMITNDDIVILLSNSGGSTELNDIIAYCKRFNIKLIGITRKNDSFLAKSAELPIILENAPQTNPINSPTTDIIMFLAYLDAIATVLIELKGFDNEKFKIFHPGGKLGSFLVKTKDIMRVGELIPVIDIDRSVREALSEMNAKSIGSVCIVENEKLVGIISDGDLRRKTLEYGNIIVLSIEQLMTKNPKSIGDESLAVEAVGVMTEKEKYIQVLPIINYENKIVGILHIQDLFRAKII